MTNYNLITVTDFQNYAPEVDLSAYTSATISGMITQASQAIAEILDYTPIAEVITDEVQKGVVNSRGDLVIFPQKIPVQSLSSLVIFRGSVSVNVGLTTNGVNRYSVDYNQRKISYPSEEMTLQGSPVFTNFYSLRNTDFLVRFTYRAGFEPSQLPESIKYATILYMREILTSRYNVANADRVTQGGITLEYTNRTVDQENKIMKQIRQLIASYLR